MRRQTRLEPMTVSPEQAGKIPGLTAAFISRRMDDGTLPFAYVDGRRECSVKDVLALQARVVKVVWIVAGSQPVAKDPVEDAGS
jgi:hypothetical protein